MGVRFVVRSRDGRKVPGELELSFDQERIVLGRGVAADVRIPHATVSEQHATVQLRDGEFVICDLGSTNGTKLSGQRLPPQLRKKLRDGDLIQMGSYVLSFHLLPVVGEAAGAEHTAELARRLVRKAHGQEGGSARSLSPRLCVVSGPMLGTTLEIPDAPARLRIGSAEDCQLVLPDPEVGREHAELVHDFEGVLLRSLPPHGTLRVGEAALSARRLRDGDELVLGTTRLLFEEPTQATLDALRNEPDAPFLEPPPDAELALVEKTAQLPEATQAAPAHKPSPSPGRHLDADLLIYVLAGLVLVASLAGLLALLNAR